MLYFAIQSLNPDGQIILDEVESTFDIRPFINKGDLIKDCQVLQIDDPIMFDK